MGKSSIILTFLETEISDQDLKEQQKQPIFNFSCIKGAGMGYTLQGRNFYSESLCMYSFVLCIYQCGKKKICLFLFHFYWLFSCWLMDRDASRRFSWFTNLFKQFISWVKGGQKVLTFSYSWSALRFEVSERLWRHIMRVESFIFMMLGEDI